MSTAAGQHGVTDGSYKDMRYKGHVWVWVKVFGEGAWRPGTVGTAWSMQMGM